MGAKEASEAAAKQWQAAEQGSGGSVGFSRWSSRLPFGLPPRRLFGLFFVSGFLLFHGLYPLRHFVLYPGNPSWHEEGHNGASWDEAPATLPLLPQRLHTWSRHPIHPDVVMCFIRRLAHEAPDKGGPCRAHPH